MNSIAVDSAVRDPPCLRLQRAVALAWDRRLDGRMGLQRKEGTWQGMETSMGTDGIVTGMAESPLPAGITSLREDRTLASQARLHPATQNMADLISIQNGSQPGRESTDYLRDHRLRRE